MILTQPDAAARAPVLVEHDDAAAWRDALEHSDVVGGRRSAVLPRGCRPGEGACMEVNHIARVGRGNSDQAPKVV